MPEHPTSPQTTHVLERTSPKGEQFIGKCSLCGKEGLTAQQANEPCPNPGNVSRDEALLNTIIPGKLRVPVSPEDMERFKNTRIGPYKEKDAN